MKQQVSITRNCKPAVVPCNTDGGKVFTGAGGETLPPSVCEGTRLSKVPESSNRKGSSLLTASTGGGFAAPPGRLLSCPEGGSASSK